MPIITPKTSSKSFAAPNFDSAIAKQFASFSMRIFLSKFFSKSSLNGFPIKHCVLLFFIKPVCFEITPGVHTPKEKSEMF